MGDNMIGHSLKTIMVFVGVYLLYIVISCVVVPYFYHPKADPFWKPATKLNQNDKKVVSPDKVVLLQDREDSGLARLQLIKNAKKSVDISTYAIHKGPYADLFFGCLFDAANRGVKVRLLLDGIVNQFNKDLRLYSYAIFTHPNIELKYYEPLHLGKPWTWNNRFHDKLFIIDSELAIVGGRNIGDKYFSAAGTKGASNDRDVIVFTEEQKDTSVLMKIDDYYQYVWEHPFSKNAVKKISHRKIQLGKEKAEEAMDLLTHAKDVYPLPIDKAIDWKKDAYSTDKVFLLHNPHQRVNKDPLIWKELISLTEQSTKSIYLESPYIVPTKKMLEYVKPEKIKVDHWKVLTNSAASTPNMVAFSGYWSNRHYIINWVDELFEYQEKTESLHGKTYIFDEKISLIGSYNVDARSTFLNTETMLLIDSEEFAHFLQKELNKTVDNHSLQVSEDGSYKAKEDVEQADVAFWKRIAIKTLAPIIKLFAFLV
ncbi:phospholipase D-like domain-containing protein [Bacillus sp. T2.9-1]|nr:phospholipase D family protein [Bacillus sp. T2.9-1]